MLMLFIHGKSQFNYYSHRHLHEETFLLEIQFSLPYYLQTEMLEEKQKQQEEDKKRRTEADRRRYGRLIMTNR